MKHYENLRDAFELCDAIGSPVRLEILEHIQSDKATNLDTLAKSLRLTNGALTKHIKKLEDVGLIKVTTTKGKRGYQKQCSINQDAILIDVSNEVVGIGGDAAELPIGLYSDFSVSGHSGLTSVSGYIGLRDEREAFLSPSRAQAAALWLEKGALTYLLPEFRRKKAIEEISFTAEMSPDFIGGGKIDSSRISFVLNGTGLGSCEIFAPQADRRGFLNPEWYDSKLPQFGSLHTLRITRKGSFLDGEKLSGQTLSLIGKPERITLATESGLMLFGAGFGDYNSHIRIAVTYSE